MLLGHGADELCAGYSRHRMRFKAEVRSRRRIFDPQTGRAVTGVNLHAADHLRSGICTVGSGRRHCSVRGASTVKSGAAMVLPMVSA